ICISNFYTYQAKTVAKMFDDLCTPYTVNQFSYNLLNRRPERIGLVDEIKRQNRGIVAYGPLAEGLLSDRYLDGVPEDFAIHPTSKYVMQAGTDKVTDDLNKLNDIAKKRDQTLSQMALAWLLKDPVVSSVIIGTTNIDHLQDNLEAAKNIRFDQEELDAIDAITK